MALTGSNQTVSDTYEHDAWGVLLSSTGSTANPHTYVGRERYYRMANADLYHLGFRDYAQALGRFMTVDPAREGLYIGRRTWNRSTLLRDATGRAGTRPPDQDPPGICDVPCGSYPGEAPYYPPQSGHSSPLGPCDPCRSAGEIGKRLLGWWFGAADSMLAGIPSWYLPGLNPDTGRVDPRFPCKFENMNPYACVEGRFAGQIFIPYDVDPCTGECVLRHERVHLARGVGGLRGSGAWVECPSMIEEARCLIDYLFQAQCCISMGTSVFGQISIRLARSA